MLNHGLLTFHCLRIHAPSYFFFCKSASYCRSSNVGLDRRVARGSNGSNCPPNSENSTNNFEVDQAFDV